MFASQMIYRWIILENKVNLYLNKNLGSWTHWILQSKDGLFGLNRKQTSGLMMALSLVWSFCLAIPPLFGWGSYLPEARHLIIKIISFIFYSDSQNYWHSSLAEKENYFPCFLFFEFLNSIHLCNVARWSGFNFLFHEILTNIFDFRSYIRMWMSEHLNFRKVEWSE